MSQETINNNASFIWSIAELLRGDFKQSDYGKIVLPFTILRRLDCILEATKSDVVELAAGLDADTDDEVRAMVLGNAANAGGQVYNASPFTFATLRQQDTGQLRKNLIDYLMGFSPNVRDIFIEKFEFTEVLKKLDEAESLWMVFDRFCQIDFHPDAITNLEMGYLFEELIRRFSEISNETAGEHFTPREVVRLLVDLLLANDEEALSGKGIIRRVYDPACGTGGMLSVAEESMKAMNPALNVDLFGQELNGESFAICKSDMLVKGHDASRIAFGNTLTQDAHRGETFHYMLSNPPYGVDWKKYAAPIKEEAEDLGYDGRFGAGLPRISDGQLLFVQHMISKMRDDEKGSRMGIVMNGSPLFTGGAGSGESEIRRWLMENDLVEAIIALPTDIFYNTGIQTYIWLLSNRKPEARRGKVQLIDASGERFWQSMRKSLGSKRRAISDDARAETVRIYGEFLNGEAGFGDVSKTFDTTDFGYREIRVERPLRLRFELTEEKLQLISEHRRFGELKEAGPMLLDGLKRGLAGHVWMDRAEFVPVFNKALRPFGKNISAPLKKGIIDILGDTHEDAEICVDKNGNPEPDPKLRDHELVPLLEDWQAYFVREVEPFVPDAWVDTSHRDASDGEVGRVGYEINFNRYFYQYAPPRPLAEIDGELKALEAEIAGLLKEVVA
ncbi:MULTISPECIES: type I restriction-modification system subunit M [unclassified Sulfitobacter]|uniref:type I restriction-modification system subunit M n=1 Tax=unclassified Sulfitobacter TaxID=196795 RepID=UPI0007C34321|nr:MULTISPECIES: class I SAM-dependent DNA methyltransferase [unclassified Sulfitobacter]KZX91952.1 restriction endonuclease subunit M [Sulfitobacter sp. HI0021]KZY00752.1 restriction endonuclease subunit M [Sulfitobacter sp. HI0027]KZZ01719.1 restriction endonuclease subunit M [Sulfitobacter sp. HI0076]